MGGHTSGGSCWPSLVSQITALWEIPPATPEIVCRLQDYFLERDFERVVTATAGFTQLGCVIALFANLSVPHK